MKIICHLLFVSLISLNAHSQHAELSAGGGFNLLRISNEHFDSKETRNGSSYTFSLSFDEFFSDTTPLKVSLRFTNYSGSYGFVDASPGGGKSVEYEFNDYLLGIGFYPLNFKITRIIELNFGAQADYVLYSKADGRITYWSISNPAGREETAEGEAGKTIVGITGNLAFNFNISDKIYLFPQYNYYMNFRQVRSIRHQFEIGVGKILQKRN